MADRANTGGKGRGVERDHRLLAHARPRDRRLAKHLSHRHPEPRERRDLMGEATREHPVEALQIGRDIERKSMSCHASRHAHPDSRDLRWPAVRKIHPYARLTCLTVSDDPVRRQRVAQTELERAHVGDKISSLAETGDRISDKLSWPVVGDVATSVDAVDRNTPTPKHFGCDEQVIDRSAPTDRVDRIVLEEKQPLGSAGADARRDGFLESPRVQIIGPRKPGRAQRRAHKTGVSARGTCRSAWYDERT